MSKGVSRMFCFCSFMTSKNAPAWGPWRWLVKKTPQNVVGHVKLKVASFTLCTFLQVAPTPYPKKTFEVDFRYYRMIVCIRSVCVFFETIYKGFCTRIFWARCTFPGDVSLVCLKMMAALLSLEALTDLKSWIAFGGV